MGVRDTLRALAARKASRQEGQQEWPRRSRTRGGAEGRPARPSESAHGEGAPAGGSTWACPPRLPPWRCLPRPGRGRQLLCVEHQSPEVGGALRAFCGRPTWIPQAAITGTALKPPAVPLLLTRGGRGWVLSPGWRRSMELSNSPKTWASGPQRRPWPVLPFWPPASWAPLRPATCPQLGEMRALSGAQTHRLHPACPQPC